MTLFPNDSEKLLEPRLPCHQHHSDSRFLMLTPTSDIDSCLAVRELGSVVRVRVRARIGLSIHKQLARHEYIIPYTSIEFDHSTIGILRNMSYGGRHSEWPASLSRATRPLQCLQLRMIAQLSQYRLSLHL